MRLLGLDLGTKSLGMAITDKTGMIAQVYKVLKFSHEDYEYAASEVVKVIKDESVSKIVLGLPKNMDGTEGFASKRSRNFKALLESKTDVPIVLMDERLTTVEAENILIDADVSREKRKDIIDGVSAQIILESYIRLEESK